jgi:hypothetical protein
VNKSGGLPLQSSPPKKGGNQMSVSVVIKLKLKRALAGKDPTARALIGSFFRICQHNIITG